MKAFVSLNTPVREDRMDLNQLKYFLTVAKLEHMTLAAQELHIAQPALSIAIAKLETDLGCPLFDRRGRNIVLNAAGKVLLEHAERIFLELADAKTRIGELTDISHQHISLAATNSRFLLGLLKEFLLLNSQVSFFQFVSSVDSIRYHLRAGEIDFGITSMPIADPEIESVSLLEEEILVCLPKMNPLSDRVSVKLQELSDENFIFLPKNYCFQELVNNYCKAAQFSPRVVFEGDPSLTYEILQSGRGIKFISKSSSYLYAGAQVSFLHIEEPAFRRTICLSQRKDRYLSDAAMKFKSFTIDYYRRHYEAS